MNKTDIVSLLKHDQDKDALITMITNLIDFTGMQSGSIPIFDSVGGNHLKNGKVIKDSNGFTILDNNNTQLFRVDNTRRVIIGDGTIGSIGLTKDGVQVLTASGWVNAGISFSDTGWVNLTLQNGWVSYGYPFPSPQCRRIGNVIMLRGVMRSGLKANGTTVFTLPSGFEPVYSMRISNPASGTHEAYIHISANREVSIWNAGDANWYGFDGTIFYND